MLYRTQSARVVPAVVMTAADPLYRVMVLDEVKPEKRDVVETVRGRLARPRGGAKLGASPSPPPRQGASPSPPPRQQEQRQRQPAANTPAHGRRNTNAGGVLSSAREAVPLVAMLVALILLEVIADIAGSTLRVAAAALTLFVAAKIGAAMLRNLF